MRMQPFTSIKQKGETRKPRPLKPTFISYLMDGVLDGFLQAWILQDDDRILGGVEEEPPKIDPAYTQ